MSKRHISAKEQSKKVVQIWNWFSTKTGQDAKGDYIKDEKTKSYSFALSGRLGTKPTGTWTKKKEAVIMTITLSKDQKEITLEKGEKRKGSNIYYYKKGGKSKEITGVINKGKGVNTVLTVSFGGKTVSVDASKRKIEDKNETLKKDVKKAKKSIRKADLKGKLREEALKVGKQKKRGKFTDDNIEDLVSVQLKF